MKESAFILQNTLYTQYFGADYASWNQKLVDIYTRYNHLLGHTYNQKMVDHNMIEDKLSCTTYEDGTKVYVNYSYNDYTLENNIVPARDYIVVQ